jgi:anion-transporting  ArsA/GET3 family ATPase
MSLLDRLARRGLLVVTGKGGVGKTTIVAILGRLLAARGRRVLLLELDPRENLHRLLGVPPVGGEIVLVEPGLWLENVRPRAVLEALVRHQVKVPLLAGKIVQSPVFRHFADGAPGLKEMAVLGHAWQLLRGEAKPRVDTVILDAPATGHGLALLSAPLLVGAVLGRGPLGKLAGQLADFVGDPKQVGVVIGTLAEEMPVQEAAELITQLDDRLGRPPELVIANALYPEFPRRPPRAPRGTTEAVTLWKQRRKANERELARLGRVWSGPQAELPLLAIPPGPALLAELQGRLAEALHSR